jgi:hypothetical protein
MAYPMKLRYRFVSQYLHNLICAQIHVFTYLITLIAPRNEALLILIPI